MNAQEVLKAAGVSFVTLREWIRRGIVPPPLEAVKGRKRPVQSWYLDLSLLASYFAGAVAMPYDRMLEAARDERYDLELLGHRFGASFEQVCHRLTSLRKPGAEGIPLHHISNGGGLGIRYKDEQTADIAAYVTRLRAMIGSRPLELLLEPTLSICCFRYVSPEVNDLDMLNQRLHRRLTHENRHMPSTTRVNGQLALRPCFVGARSEMGHADALVDDVLRLGAELAREPAALP